MKARVNLILLCAGLGMAMGLLIGAIIHNHIVNSVELERGYMIVKPYVIYEDGSYSGCLPERLCDE